MIAYGLGFIIIALIIILVVVMTREPVCPSCPECKEIIAPVTEPRVNQPATTAKVSPVGPTIRLVIVGPGIMSIPPKGWGAVESLIWDQKCVLEEDHGIEVQIVNSPDRATIIHEVDRFDPDIVHIQYDEFADLVDQFRCKRIILTSHYGYLSRVREMHGHYADFIQRFVYASLNGAYLHCLSPEIQNVLLEFGAKRDRTFVLPNGANEKLFRYTIDAEKPNRSIYLAKIETRKRQHVYQEFDIIDFAGNCVDDKFNTSRSNYLGEWTKEHLYEHLTEYANLVLLSDGEAHALVCCEALIAGLGLVVSEAAAANLDRSQPFIRVIPMDRLDDLKYIREAIIENQFVSRNMRERIREYALQHFSWRQIWRQYIEFVRREVGT